MANDIIQIHLDDEENGCYLMSNESYAEKRYIELKEYWDSRCWVNFLLFIWIVVVVVMLFRGVANPNLWFDESGQFWMSNGLNHYSAPYSPRGSIADAINANIKFNMDPGGYTVALRYWVLFGTSPAWLRGFSFLFFLLTMLAYAGIAWEWTRSHVITLAAGLVAASSPILLHFAFELRPYSMEACGVVITIFLLERASRRPAISKFLLIGMVCSIFILSRYSFVVMVIAAGIGVFKIVYEMPLRQRCAYLVIYLLPVLLVSAGMYIVMLKNQNVGIKPPDYVQIYILQGKPLRELLQISFKGLFSVYAIGSTLFVATYLLLSWCKVKSAKHELFSLYFLIVVTVTALFVLLSIMGKYPWCPNERWGITLHVLSMLSWLPLGLMIVRSARLSEKIGWKRVRFLMAGGTAVAALLIAFKIHYKTPDTTYENIIAIGPEKFVGKRVFVNNKGKSTVRYLYEFGPLQKYASSTYPKSFLLEDMNNSKQQWDSFDFLIFSHMSRETVMLQLGESISQFREVGKYSDSPIFQNIR